MGLINNKPAGLGGRGHLKLIMYMYLPMLWLVVCCPPKPTNSGLISDLKIQFSVPCFRPDNIEANKIPWL